MEKSPCSILSGCTNFLFSSRGASFREKKSRGTTLESKWPPFNPPKPPGEGRVVGTSFISFAPPQAAGLTHSAAPPLPTKAEDRFCGGPFLRPSPGPYPPTTKGGALRRPSPWTPPRAALHKVCGLRALLRNGPRLGRPRRQRRKAVPAGGVSSGRKPEGQYHVSGSGAKGKTGRSEGAAVREDRQGLFWGRCPPVAGVHRSTESKTRPPGGQSFHEKRPPGKKKENW